MLHKLKIENSDRQNWSTISAKLHAAILLVNTPSSSCRRRRRLDCMMIRERRRRRHQQPQPRDLLRACATATASERLKISAASAKQPRRSPSATTAGGERARADAIGMRRRKTVGCGGHESGQEFAARASSRSRSTDYTRRLATTRACRVLHAYKQRGCLDEFKIEMQNKSK